MKISAMVLVGDNEPYLDYCIESIKDVVDDIIFFCRGNISHTLGPLIPTYDLEDDKGIDIKNEEFRDKIEILGQEEKEVDFSKWRNTVLEEMTNKGTDWVLFVDADEIFANADGTPVTRKQLEEIIETKYKFNDGKEHLAESFDLFTRHFVWNYFTIDARNNGQHFSAQRLFRLPTGSVHCEYARPVHEILFWYKKKHGTNKRFMYDPKRIRLNVERRAKKSCPYWVITEEEGNKIPIIWHFGQCKGMENIRERYRKRDMPENPWYEKDKNTDQKCAEHPLFRGSLPAIHYAGKLPKVMKLW